MSGNTFKAIRTVMRARYEGRHGLTLDSCSGGGGGSLV
jgi:hypothetical protein